jgi:hypothetical protein
MPVEAEIDEKHLVQTRYSTKILSVICYKLTFVNIYLFRFFVVVIFVLPGNDIRCSNHALKDTWCV